MQGVQPLDCTLSGGQVIGLRPRFPPFPAAEGGVSNEDQQSSSSLVLEKRQHGNAVLL